MALEGSYINLDSETKAKAKELGINISEFCRDKLAEAVNPENEIKKLELKKQDYFDEIKKIDCKIEKCLALVENSKSSHSVFADEYQEIVNFCLEASNRIKDINVPVLKQQAKKHNIEYNKLFKTVKSAMGG